MMNDNRFDDLLQEAAREHNSAPDTPRAEMWAAIAAARGGARKTAVPDGTSSGTPPVEPRTVPVRVIPLYARHRRTLAMVVGLAATLLVGVMIGRATHQVVPPAVHAPATARAGAPVNDAGSPAASTTEPATVAAAPAAPVSADNAPGGVGPVIKSPVPPSNSLQRSATTVALAPNGDADASASTAAGATLQRDVRAEEARPYRMAAMQHLVTTEALLISLRGDVRAGRKDTTIAVWAGDLLGTTRMLIDSPAGRDPQLKQLLEDLELVLAQISRLPGAHGEAADLGLIDDAVRHRQIMTRLRALSPDT